MKVKLTVILVLLCTLLLYACDNTYPVTQPEAPVSNTLSEAVTEDIKIPPEPVAEDVETLPEGITEGIYMLPEPMLDGDMSVEAALDERRSRRGFRDMPLTKEQLSQILWAAYGISETDPATGQRGRLRTAPSAGATYPLEVYAVVGNVDGLSPGIYRYIPEEHKLVRISPGDVRGELMAAALGQRMVGDAPATIFYSAVFDRITVRYGERGIMYAYIELGHSAQNVYLQVEALGLGTVAIGAFTDDRVREVLRLPPDETPLYLLPIGFFN